MAAPYQSSVKSPSIYREKLLKSRKTLVKADNLHRTGNPHRITQDLYCLTFLIKSKLKFRLQGYCSLHYNQKNIKQISLV